MRQGVAAAVLGLLDDPGPLVAELSRAEAILNHGDLKYANLGLTADRVILLDWGTFTGMAPPAAAQAPDEAERVAARAELRWWYQRAQAALDHW